MSAFDAAIALTLNEEKGYTPGLPNDPGGETNFGISKKSYPNENIKSMTKERAIAIYRRDFWDAPGLDRLAEAIAVAVFDAEVNSGTGGGVIILQTALNRCGRSVKVDGGLGEKTAAAANSLPAGELLRCIQASRIIYDARLNNWETFEWNWCARILDVYRVCLALL